MFEDIKKAQVEQKLRALINTGVIATPEEFAKSFTKDELAIADQDLIEKAVGHKYFKREGTPGNYKYYYTEAEYKEAKGGKGKVEFDYSKEKYLVGNATGYMIPSKENAEKLSKEDIYTILDKLSERQAKAAENNDNSALSEITSLSNFLSALVKTKPIKAKYKNYEDYKKAGGRKSMANSIMDGDVEDDTNEYTREQMEEKISKLNNYNSLVDKVAKHYNVSREKVSKLKLDGTDTPLELSRALGLHLNDTNFEGVKGTIKKLSGEEHDF